MASSMAIDEGRGWVLGASDTGHLFVLDMDTGRVIRETYMGVPAWQPGDGEPTSGFYFPGYSAIALVPSQGIFYIGGTDYARAWQGSSRKGREKLFCYDYVSGGSTITHVWSYQFLGTGTPPANEYVVKGHDPYQVSGYSLSSPALADGHVYYGSWNGHVYCFGAEFPPPVTTTTSSIQPTTTTTEPATLITLSSFDADPGNNQVKLIWATESEIDTAGFNIYRSESFNGEFVKINEELIPAKGSSTEGASYEFTDKDLNNRRIYFYKLEDIDTFGNSTFHGPVHAMPRLIYGTGNN